MNIFDNNYGQVQGIDFAYTLQGWIKGVNSSVAQDQNPLRYDMGKDGIGSGGVNPVAQDAVGYTIGYHVNIVKQILIYML